MKTKSILGANWAELSRCEPAGKTLQRRDRPDHADKARGGGLAKILLVLLLAFPAALAVSAGSAAAASNQCPTFSHWEDWIGGARVHGKVTFRPSDTCNGRHVKDAYIHIIRQCGPYFDPGRWYTSTATSQSDSRTYSVEGWIFDSILWGCNTNVYYGYDYF